MSEISVNSILDATGGATTTINGFTPTVSNMAGRNRIINGDMRIDQRNAGAAVTATTSNTYPIDRFFTRNSTETGTITGQQSTLGNSKSMKVTATAAVTDLTTSKLVYGVSQRIESFNVVDLQNKTITASFTVETNWSGNLAVAFRATRATVQRAYVVDVAVTSGVNNISVTMVNEDLAFDSANSQGLQLTIGFNNEDTYQTATTGAWLAGAFFTSTSSTQWAKTTGNFINITDLQLEEGSVATPFEHRQYGLELALCQRYFQTYGGNSIYERFGGGFNYLTTQSRIDMFLATTMRSTPTLTISSASHFSVEYGGGAIVCTAISLDQPSTKVVSLNCDVSSGLGQGQGVHLNASGTLAARLNLSAEL
jgi:hypothetical protein